MKCHACGKEDRAKNLKTVAEYKFHPTCYEYFRKNHRYLPIFHKWVEVKRD